MLIGETGRAVHRRTKRRLQNISAWMMMTKKFPDQQIVLLLPVRRHLPILGVRQNARSRLHGAPKNRLHRGGQVQMIEMICHVRSRHRRRRDRLLALRDRHLPSGLRQKQLPNKVRCQNSRGQHVRRLRRRWTSLRLMNKGFERSGTDILSIARFPTRTSGPRSSTLRWHGIHVCGPSLLQLLLLPMEEFGSS